MNSVSSTDGTHIKEMKNVAFENHRLTIREIADVAVIYSDQFKSFSKMSSALNALDLDLPKNRPFLVPKLEHVQ